MVFEHIPPVAPTVPQPPTSQLLRRWLLVVLSYYLSGRLGLAAPSIDNSITLIWLPTGIAVAALVRWGWRMWPAVWLGALLVNLSIGSTLVTAVGISIGNVLGPLWAAWLLRKINFQPSFEHRKDVGWLVIAAMTGMLLSASGGVLSLRLTNELATSHYWAAWLTWWLGDTVGVLLAAPLLLTLTRRNLAELGARRLEILGFCIALLAIDWFIYLPPYGRHALAFVPVFLILWAAMRFGITGASISVLVSSIIAAWGTATGFGPFYILNPTEAMLIAWAYMTTLVVVSLVVTALLAESRYAASELRLHSQILHNMMEGVYLVRASDLVIVYTNPTFDKMFGYAPGELLGEHVSRINANREKTPQKVAEEIHQTLLKEGSWHGEILNLKKDGTAFWCETSISSFDHYDLGPVWVSVHADITQRKEAEEKINFLAFYDPLTQLPNRRLLLERLRHLAASGKRNKHHAALLFIDLDNFKQLNDTRGHNIGDLLLIDVAKRLRTVVREGDTVSRLGGDEFVIVLPALNDDREQASAHTGMVAEKIRAALDQPYMLEGLMYRCSPSIGIDVFLERETDANEALKRADTAMYQAKAAGRNTVRFSQAA